MINQKDLDELLSQCTKRSRHWLSDAVANGDVSEAADDFVRENGHGSASLANSILIAMGQEPIFTS